jgi:hypothetical protein
MRNAFTTTAIILTALIASGVALAGTATKVPEPVSMSLLAGGIATIAAIRLVRRK